MSSLTSRPGNVPEVGELVDIFVLRKELYQGAMATLFLAEEPFSGRQVVVKIPCGDILNQPILFYHYQNEEQISRLIDHPGIIRFIQRCRSRQYIIMEYLEGRDLRSMVGLKRAISLESGLGLMSQLCEVATYLHSRGIVHLDLKPENIICLPDNTIKVIDFGLASCRGRPDLLALDLKNPQGTPWYIAPEQLLGERNDPRCDIYSMGMLFYEMLTGQLPWPRSAKVRVARRRLRQLPTPPRYYNPDIPPRIQQIILRAIAPKCEDRYQSAEELRTDLDNWQDLPVTSVGTNSRRLSFWRRIFSLAPIRVCRQQRDEVHSGEEKVRIIGGFIDSPSNLDVVTEIKKQALIHTAEVTLIHVIEEETDDHVTRYGVVVEGEKLMAELEGAIQKLRCCGLDPSVRLIRGEAVEVLKKVCREGGVVQLILGKSRKKEGLLGGASVPRRLMKDGQCSAVMIAETNPFSPLTDLAPLSPEDLNGDQVLDCDIFLVDLWYEHLQYHTDFIYKRFLFGRKDFDLDEENCFFGRWLKSLAETENWPEIMTTLGPIHDRFHSIARRMSDCDDHDWEKVRQFYQNESLPLACSMKKELARVSAMLRNHLDQPPPMVPFLADKICPVAEVEKIGCGPLLAVVDLNQDLCALIEKGGGKI
ncbi:MAG: protein kinase, partial [Thermodesulfobacteriota bacterium]